MPDLTTYYEFEQPLGGEQISPGPFNRNWGKADGVLFDFKGRIETLERIAIPKGGSDGQALIKNGANDNAVKWAVLPIKGGGTGATSVAGARNALGLGNTSGAVPVANGGTGLTSAPSLLINLASTSAVNVLTATPRPGVTGILGRKNGGTGVDSSSVAANRVYASPNGAAGNGSWRALVAADIPPLSYLKSSGGTVSGNITISKSSDTAMLYVNRTDVGVNLHVGVASDGKKHGMYSSKLGGWIVHADTSSVYLNGKNVSSVAKNRVFASPKDATGEASFRALVGDDLPSIPVGKIPTLDIGSKTSGTLAVNRGGTGATSAKDARANLGIQTGTATIKTTANYRIDKSVTFSKAFTSEPNIQLTLRLEGWMTNSAGVADEAAGLTPSVFTRTKNGFTLRLWNRHVAAGYDIIIDWVAIGDM